MYGFRANNTQKVSIPNYVSQQRSPAAVPSEQAGEHKCVSELRTWCRESLGERVALANMVPAVEVYQANWLCVWQLSCCI